MANPSGGMRMSFTSDVTMPPNAAPMITPTARSTALPLIANSLNSFHIIPLLYQLATTLTSFLGITTILRTVCPAMNSCTRGLARASASSSSLVAAIGNLHPVPNFAVHLKSDLDFIFNQELGL